MIGWIKLFRSSLESTVWRNPVVWFVWSWILLKANHETVKFPFNGEDIEIRRGEFITGLYKAVSELPGVTPQMYRTAITYLKSTNRITTKSTNKYTIISVTNWDKYQDELTNKSTNEQQTSNKPVTTNKNDKKREKRETTPPQKEYPTPESVDKDCVTRIAQSCGVEASQVLATLEKLRLYSLKHPGKYTDFNETLRNWILTDIQSGKIPGKKTAQEKYEEDLKRENPDIPDILRRIS